MKEAGKGYSTINTARAALSTVICLDSGQAFGSLPIVKQFMRGIFNLTPPKPRYIHTWDPQQVLGILKTWSPAKKLSLKKLSYKTVMLVLLSTGLRGRTILGLRTDKMEVSQKEITFIIENKDVKQGRPGYKPPAVKLVNFPADKRLCVHWYMQEYLKRTLDVRGKEKYVFLAIVKPHGKISRDTLSRWVKCTLIAAGIDMNTFKAGSTRSAVTSKAWYKGASADEILEAGGWSRESTFTKWYKKDIKKDTPIRDYVFQ